MDGELLRNIVITVILSSMFFISIVLIFLYKKKINKGVIKTPNITHTNLIKKSTFKTGIRWTKVRIYTKESVSPRLFFLIVILALAFIIIIGMIFGQVG